MRRTRERRVGLADPDAAETNLESFAVNSVAEYRHLLFREQPVDLLRELFRAQADIGTDQVLLKFGVPTNVTPHCGLDTVETHGPFCEPVAGGRPMVICPVMAGDELADLLAFDPRAPNQWWCRLGGEPLLGTGALADQLTGQPLHVYRTPLSWLQHGCDGVVPLDFNRASIDLITAQNGIVAEDDAHVSELRRALTEAAQRRLPDIYLRRREAA